MLRSGLTNRNKNLYVSILAATEPPVGGQTDLVTPTLGGNAASEGHVG